MPAHAFPNDDPFSALTLPATLSIASASVGLLAALLALGMSSAPGWRELRWFAACATFAALYNLVNVPFTTSHAPPAVLILATRLNLVFAGLYAVTWFRYVAASEKRLLTRGETAWAVLGIGLSLMTLVPGLVVENQVRYRTVAFFNTAYADVAPTRLGYTVVAFYVASMAALFVRALVRRRKGDARATTHAIALGAVVACGAHDAIAVAGYIRDPYLLDFAVVVMVLAVGGSITSSFVASARALEESSRQLALAQRELVDKERLAALGELAAVVAHEVRNPLAVVFNATAGLRRVDSTPADHVALVSIIQEEAERLRDLVSDLLDFARPRPTILDEAPVAEVVRSAVDTALSVVGVAPSEVTIDVELGVDRVTCDERLLRQAVVNLVTNALHAEGRRSPVRVTLFIAEGFPGVFVVCVADDGRGIADDVRERIFTPFFSTRPKGTGLGLAIVVRCAEAHGGEISVRTTPGGGATFELRLPRRRSV